MPLRDHSMISYPLQGYISPLHSNRQLLTLGRACSYLNMSDSDSFTDSIATRVQARVIIGVAIGCITGLVLLVLAAIRYIRRRRVGRIIENAPGKDLQLEEGDSVAQTPGESGFEKATCKDEIQSPQPEAGLSKPEAAAIHEEDVQIKQQTPRSDVRVVYVSVEFNFRI